MLHHTYLYLLEKAALTQATAKATCTIFEYISALVVHANIAVIATISNNTFKINRINWKSHSTLTLLATQDLPTFLYYMIDPLKSWCWGAILFYPFKNSRFS